MIIQEYIDIKVFMLSLIFGIFIVYIFHEQPKIVLRNPLIKDNNGDNHEYKNNTCFKSEEIKC